MWFQLVRACGLPFLQTMILIVFLFFFFLLLFFGVGYGGVSSYVCTNCFSYD